ncbi:hypothetical protein [cf. Phormidesmis sp. LEGE 11477]|uniref:hypothetical protein n=1 Tax=cf. Phormidesmis sp. LEGE 11477 TaxID=1828680 RepID=UPI00187EA114|nr:hypothetical protein [cf. Phormidesmis sp. LEGE 11477]MBE9059607.1 hypothetical protein [cf. Phormidesmis sp. LEGE 11477]
MISDSSSTPGPLSPGNVVSAALRIYRDRFKTYFGLSARACLWLLVPVYGWAKYGMHTGLIARMAYQELINQPETPKQAYQQVNPKLWSFLGLGILFILIFIATYIVLGIAAVIVSLIVSTLLGPFLSLIGPSGVLITSIIGGLLFLAIFFFGLLWMASRLFLVEVPLALEPGNDATKSIGRSWALTKNSIVRIQLVVLATYLITLPLLLLTGILPQLLLLPRFEPGTAVYSIVYLILFAVSLAGSMVVLPFWQAAKGVLYYDLRSRREGLDLQIQPTDI